eukprot:TRINITY_DN6152_c0_g2_i11.p1 TRINITY_DN6152_c0_g2~~TRINITY_DN6152_c0_g2_i11.p1  ORF type:complete len:508 (+),score=77.13 TRINITY_DN6152_c0_g2_i11:204-1727(+)
MSVRSRVFGNRTLGLFECQVPENHCNVQLGSRRKSLDVRVNYSATAKLDVEALPVGVVATALNILQNGRPDVLLSPCIYFKISEACAQAVDKLKSTGKTIFDRSEVLKACQNMLDSSEIEVPQKSAGGRRLESFTSTSIGTCEGQEDRAVHVGSISQLCGSGSSTDTSQDHLIAIFDGHGGNQCSEFAMEWVPWEIGRCGLKTDAEESIRQAFKSSDTRFMKVAETENLEAGCTALACLIRNDKITCANLGDCRAVIGRLAGDGVQPDVLTSDHNVKSPKEVEGVISRGGMILRNRVNGVLSVTRALGNKSCRVLLSQDPDVITREIDWKTDEFLVIGSDGLYDRMSNQEIVDFIHNAKAKIDKKLQDLRQALAEHTASQEQDDEAMAVLGLANSSNTAASPATIPINLAEQFLKCSYQQVADDLVQHCVSISTGYCDNTTCVILFFDANSLTAVELGESLQVVGEDHDRKAEEKIVVTKTEEDEEEDDGFDPMEQSSAMMRPPGIG